MDTGAIRAEWIHCPNCAVPRRLERLANRCASCGWLFAAGETELAIKEAREWDVVRALDAAEERERKIVEIFSALIGDPDQWAAAMQEIAEWKNA